MPVKLRWLHSGWWLGLLVSLSSSVQAQTLPPQIPNPDPPPIAPATPERLPPPADLLQLPTPATPPEALPSSVAGTIVVQRFEVVGSTVFSPGELATVTAPFTNRPITFAELLQVRSAITQRYIDRGYITTGAFIPPQTLETGTVTIQVLEGSLEDIQITGTRRLNPGYVRSRLAIATHQPLNVRRLLEALQLLQLNPLIKNLSAELSTGSQPGTSLLKVRVAEAATFNALVSLDNGRSPSVGTDRRRVQLSEANLLGLGDALSVAYTNTTGSNAFDASYTLPLSPRNSTLSFNYGTVSSRVIESPFDVLKIEAASRYYDLTFRQPLIETPNQTVAVGLTASRRESDTSLAPLGTERIDFPLSLGADARGRTRISALRFFQEWTRRSSREVLALRSEFSLGLSAFNATLNGTAPDSRFFAWRGQGQFLRLLAPDTLLLVQTDVQLAANGLVPLEQFGLGGQNSVRGYRQDLLLTDSGVRASAELQLPILRLPKQQAVLQIIPFVDVGTAWNVDRPTPDPKTLAAIGLGLQLRGKNFTARLDYGIPFVSISGSKSTWQENGLYFSLIYSPF